MGGIGAAPAGLGGVGARGAPGLGGVGSVVVAPGGEGAGWPPPAENEPGFGGAGMAFGFFSSGLPESESELDNLSNQHSLFGVVVLGKSSTVGGIPSVSQHTVVLDIPDGQNDL